MIGDAWKVVEEAVLPDMPATCHLDIKRAFYAGAIAAVREMNDSAETKAACYGRLRDECDKFVETHYS